MNTSSLRKLTCGPRCCLPFVNASTSLSMALANSAIVITPQARQFFTQIMETTLLMTRQLANPVPKLLLFVVVGWSALLFLSFGLLATFNPVSVAAEALGSLAVASAVFMILEFSQPYSGMFRISPVGVDNLISVIGH